MSLPESLFGLGNDMDQGGGRAGEDILMTASIAAAMYEIFGARAHDVAIRQIELASDRQAVTDRWQAISRAIEALKSEAKDGRKPGCE